MTSVTITLEGEWDASTIALIKGDLRNCRNVEHLLGYEIKNYIVPKYKKNLFTLFRKTIAEKGKLDISYEKVPDFVPFDQWYQKQGRTLNYEEKQKLIAQLWIAFNSVIQTAVISTKSIRMLSLNPQNVLIYASKDRKGGYVYKFKFTKYIPQIFFENVVNKTSFVNGKYDKVSNEDLMYISPRYSYPGHINAYEKNKFPVVSGIKEIMKEDILYSFGLLLAYILHNDHAIKNYTYDILLNYFYNQIIPDEINDFELLEKQFVTALLKYTEYKDIINNQYINTLKNKLNAEEIDLNSLKVLKSIGGGAYADVFMVEQTLPNGETRIIAVKEFDLSSLSIADVMLEYDLMSLCSCPNSVKPFGLCTSRFPLKKDGIDTSHLKMQKNPKEGCAFILMECCNMGSLNSYIKKNYPHGMIPKEFIEHVFIELLSGIWFLHSVRCIIHRDIKPDNILLMSNPRRPNYPQIKLSDLGVSKIILNDDEQPATFIGTPMYMAPEMSTPPYTYKTDLWALACTMYQIVTFRLPFGFEKLAPITKANYTKPIFHSQIWEGLTGLQNVLEHIFVYDDDERWGWPQIFRDEYVQKLLLKRLERRIEDGLESGSKSAKTRLTTENNTRSFKNLERFAYKK